MSKLNLSNKCNNKFGDYFRQFANFSEFSGSDSWVVLSPIEKQIKEKIERIGTPLKDWDIRINYGIKTGYNDAFIISGEKRKELIEEDPKSEEIIRPLLRGRDIKRYGYDFADLWLLYIPWHFPLHKNLNISGASMEAEKAFENQYPAIYNHLLNYKKELSNRNKAETGIRYEWYALQRWGANYWEDFSRQKIVWGEISDKTKFSIELEGKYVNEATTFLMVGSSLTYLVGYLNSKLSEYFFSKIGTTTGVGTVRWKKFTIMQLFVPQLSPSKQKEYEEIVLEIINYEDSQKDYNTLTNKLDNMIYQEFNFSKQEIEFIESQ